MSTDTPGYAFRGPGLDRAEPLRNDAAQLAARWPAASVLVVDADGHACFHGEPAAPDLARGAALAAELPGDAVFLGVDGEQAWFALAHEALAEPLPARLDLRSAANDWPAPLAAVFAQARALLHWHRRNRFCGGCGSALAALRAGWALRCGQCGLEHYPRTDPAIIVAVSDGQRLLLGRGAGWGGKRWSVLAGFVEPGESLEQTVAREVMEETGVPVLESRYAASQPWPFPMSMMIGFHATAVPVEPQVSDELEEARWFGLAELDAAVASGEVVLSPRLSIARWLIDGWIAGQRVGAPSGANSAAGQFP